MLIKILPSTSVENAFHYNERKMDGKSTVDRGEDDVRSDEEVDKEFNEENGHVLATRNLPEGVTLLAEFDRIEEEAISKKRKGRKLEKTSFHMAVSPSDTDPDLNDAKATEMIDDIMNGLGYGQQPYRIYQHTDTGRKHWHVVSIRTTENGKISDSFEKMKAHRVLRSLEAKYGITAVAFTEEEKKEQAKKKENNNLEEEQIHQVHPEDLGRDKKKSKEEKKKTDSKKDFVLPFDGKSDTPVREQIKAIHEDALKWHFSTFEQYQAILLRRYRLLTTVRENQDIEVVSYGVSKYGKTGTKGISDSELDMHILERVQNRILESDMKQYKAQKKRLEELSRAAVKVSVSFEDFKAKMNQKGVTLVVSWTKDGTPFGITWLDRGTKCAWKGSETSADLNWLNGVVAEKGWTITKDAVYETINEKILAKESQKLIHKHINERIAGAKGARKNISIGKVSHKKIHAAHHQEAGNTLKGDDDLDNKKKRRDDDSDTGQENTM